MRVEKLSLEHHNMAPRLLTCDFEILVIRGLRGVGRQVVVVVVVQPLQHAPLLFMSWPSRVAVLGIAAGVGVTGGARR